MSKAKAIHSSFLVKRPKAAKKVTSFVINSKLGKIAGGAKEESRSDRITAGNNSYKVRTHSLTEN